MLFFKLLLTEIIIGFMVLIGLVHGNGKIEVTLLSVEVENRTVESNPAYKLTLTFQEGLTFEYRHEVETLGVEESLASVEPMLVDGQFGGKLTPTFSATCRREEDESISQPVTVTGWTRNGQTFDQTFPDIDECKWKFSLAVTCSPNYYAPISCGKYCKEDTKHVESCDENGVAVCYPGYGGDDCTQDAMNECVASQTPCKNHGVCKNTVGSFVCNCLPGYRGPTCAEEIDECREQPDICANGGTCTNLAGTFSCACPSGFEGTKCSISKSTCSSEVPCINDGMCVKSNGAFHCKCTLDYFGRRCEFKRISPEGPPNMSVKLALLFVACFTMLLIIVALGVMWIKKVKNDIDEAVP